MDCIKINLDPTVWTEEKYWRYKKQCVFIQWSYLGKAIIWFLYFENQILIWKLGIENIYYCNSKGKYISLNKLLSIYKTIKNHFTANFIVYSFISQLYFFYSAEH
jgi:hypothetical protein